MATKNFIAKFGLNFWINLSWILTGPVTKVTVAMPEGGFSVSA